MADITIGIVASAREWRAVFQAHVRDHVAGVKVEILREPRMALELPLDVVVIDDVSSFLTRDKVVRLREKGTRVVGIYDAEGSEGLGEEFLTNLGVDLSLPSTISPEEMINAVTGLQPRENYNNAFGATSYPNTMFATSASESTMVAVAGPAGVGSTEIAIALSDVLVARNEGTLLIDADEVGPSVARRLGFHLHPNILSAIDAVNNVSHPLTEMVGRPSDRGASGAAFDVIPGIANPEDWTHLRSMDMLDLFAAAKRTWRYVVCNVGPFVEDLSGYGMERFGSTRATLESADIILGVMNPTPTGYMRFLDWMSSLRTLGNERSVYIVVNKAPKSSFIRGEIENQIARDIDMRFVAGLFFVPDDERVVKAEWEGQRILKGPFINSINEITAYCLPFDRSGKRKTKSHPAPVIIPQAPVQTAQDVRPPDSVSWDDPDIQYGTPDVPSATSAPVPPIPQPPSATPSAPEPQISYDDMITQQQPPIPPIPQAPVDPPSEYFGESPEAHAQYVTSGMEDLQASLRANVVEEKLEEKHDEEADEAVSGNVYSFSPPMHSVVDMNNNVSGAASVQQPTAPMAESVEEVAQDVPQTYAPSFTQDDAPATNSALGAFAPIVQPTATPDVQQPVAPAVQEQAEASTQTSDESDGYVPHFLDEQQKDTDDDSFWGQ